jgi:hypothetical protein
VATIDVACPCGRTVAMNTTLAGRQFACSVCGRDLVVPGVAPVVAAVAVAPRARRHRPRCFLLALALMLGGGVAGWLLHGATTRNPMPAGVATVADRAAIPSEPKPPIRLLPDPSGIDPDRQAVSTYLKKYGNDPAAVEVIEFMGPVPCSANWNQTIPCDCAVLATFRSRNVFGALSTQQQVFYVRGHQVVDVMDRSTGYGYWRSAMQHLFKTTIP